MVQFISLIFILITFYWASMIGFFSSKKLRNNTEESSFFIPGEITKYEKYLRVKPVIESDFFSVGNLPVLL